MRNKIISTMLVCALIFTTLLTGCSNGDAKDKAEKQQKTTKYESYIEKNPISLEEKLMSAEYSMNNTKTTIEIGSDKAKNTIMHISVSEFGEVSLYTLNKDSYLYVNKSNDDIGEWYHTTLSQQDETSDLTSSFSNMVSISDMFDGVKSCKYNKTMVQDGIEYDVLKAIVPIEQNKEETPSEEGNGVNVEIVGENEKTSGDEQIIYLYINAETEKLEKIQTSEDGYSIVIRFKDLESLTLPNNITIAETNEEEFMMSFMDGFLGILANAITPTQDAPSEDMEIPLDEVQTIQGVD